MACRVGEGLLGVEELGNGRGVESPLGHCAARSLDRLLTRGIAATARDSAGQIFQCLIWLLRNHLAWHTGGRCRTAGGPWSRLVSFPLMYCVVLVFNLAVFSFSQVANGELLPLAVVFKNKSEIVLYLSPGIPQVWITCSNVLDQ